MAAVSLALPGLPFSAGSQVVGESEESEAGRMSPPALCLRVRQIKDVVAMKTPHYDGPGQCLEAQP